MLHLVGPSPEWDGNELPSLRSNSASLPTVITFSQVPGKVIVPGPGPELPADTTSVSPSVQSRLIADATSFFSSSQSEVSEPMEMLTIFMLYLCRLCFTQSHALVHEILKIYDVVCKVRMRINSGIHYDGTAATPGQRYWVEFIYVVYAVGFILYMHLKYCAQRCRCCVIFIICSILFEIDTQKDIKYNGDCRFGVMRRQNGDWLWEKLRQVKFTGILKAVSIR